VSRAAAAPRQQGTGADTSRTAVRVLVVLDEIAASPAPRTARQLADAVGFPLATVCRFLQTLVQCGYVSRDGRAYRVSATKAQTLAEAVERSGGAGHATLAAMRALAEGTRETAYACSWRGGDVHIDAVAEGSMAVRVAGINAGLAGCAHARASGKALLAHGPRSRLERLLERGPLERVTEATIVDPDRLREDLADLRARGFAIDREEYMEGVCCIAVPVGVLDGVATEAISLTVPLQRFDAELDANVRAALTAAAGA
jgi:DNA-binding IclR family transcriptional regulator